MITEATPCYPIGPQGIPIYDNSEEVISSSLEANSANPATHPSSFLYNLSVIKDKVHQVQSLANIFWSPDHGQQPESTAIATPTMGTLIQEIIVTASSMMFVCQHMALGTPPSACNTTVELHHHRADKTADGAGPLVLSGGDHTVEDRRLANFYSNHHYSTLDQWYGDSYNNCNSTDDNNNNTGSTISININNEGSAREFPQKTETNEESQGFSPKNDDVIELDAADILAMYTHYCQVCGKGAHGDEYKSSAALSNPMKSENGENSGGGGVGKLPRKYYTPNITTRGATARKCVCKRCNRKQFSVLSDLRTHEKHCGDVKWLCSCGNTYSRKDKLMGACCLVRWPHAGY
ncbi:hypothetical protein Pfo_007299 [Paulownia fortunei]|nr:hypothetical protein Pfo_007299 [Paulownia fortunei]